MPVYMHVFLFGYSGDNRFHKILISVILIFYHTLSTYCAWGISLRKKELRINGALFVNAQPLIESSQTDIFGS